MNASLDKSGLYHGEKCLLTRSTISRVSKRFKHQKVKLLQSCYSTRMEKESKPLLLARALDGYVSGYYIKSLGLKESKNGKSYYNYELVQEHD